MADTAVSQVGGTLLDTIVDFIIPPEVVLFLNQTLIRTPFFILNYWSFVHLLFGVLFYRFVSKDLKKWLWVNLIFEFVEFMLALGGNPLFVEEAVDIFWDVIWSMAGAWLMMRGETWWKKSKK